MPQRALNGFVVTRCRYAYVCKKKLEFGGASAILLNVLPASKLEARYNGIPASTSAALASVAFAALTLSQPAKLVGKELCAKADSTRLLFPAPGKSCSAALLGAPGNTGGSHLQKGENDLLRFKPVL